MLLQEIRCIKGLLKITSDIQSLHGYDVIKKIKELGNDLGYITRKTVARMMSASMLAFTSDDFKMVLNRLSIGKSRKLRAINIIERLFEATHPNEFVVKDVAQLRLAQREKKELFMSRPW